MTTLVIHYESKAIVGRKFYETPQEVWEGLQKLADENTIFKIQVIKTKKKSDKV